LLNRYISGPDFRYFVVGVLIGRYNEKV